MVIDALVIDNFGLFRGKHEIVLRPSSPSKPVVLIGGLNGRGKTTILDAIQLALYGKRAQCSNRGSLGYREYLKRCVHRGEGSSAVEIHLSTRSEGEESTLVSPAFLERGCEHRRCPNRGSATARRGERLEESWDEYVEQLLPAGIAPLFFFDGEKIEQLADPATSQENLAISHRLASGPRSPRATVDGIFERSSARRERELADDSRTTRSWIVSRPRSTSSPVKADGYQQELRDALETGQEQQEPERRRAEDRFRKEGGELTQKRGELEQEERELENQIRSANEQSGRARHRCCAATPDRSLFLLPSGTRRTLRPLLP